jgi:hypothetical protein
MENLETIVGVALVAIFTFFFRKVLKKKEPKKAPPKDTSSDIARENIQQTLNEEVEAIEKDLSGDSPADDLAARGNARKRRK